MAAVLLPALPGPRDMTVTYVDWGGTLRPALGGPAQRLNRLGTRHRAEFVMPPMPIDTARIWVQRLKRGLHDGVIMEFPQPGFSSGLGSGTVAVATSGGATLPVQLVAGIDGRVVLEGQYLSTGNGAWQLYAVDADTLVPNDGLVSLGVTPLLRTPLLQGNSVRFTEVLIQGSLTGDEQSWTVNTAHHYGLSFGIEEDA